MAPGRGWQETPDDAKRLRELEGENRRLKKIVADNELKISMLKEIARGNFCVPHIVASG